MGKGGYIVCVSGEGGRVRATLARNVWKNQPPCLKKSRIGVYSYRTCRNTGLSRYL